MRRPLGMLAAMLAVPGITSAQDGPAEILPTLIELPSSLVPRETMISSLAWYRDNLILLPQQRAVRGEPSVHRGRLYSISSHDLLAWLSNPRDTGIEVAELRLERPNLEEIIPDYEGLEAIAFVGDRVYLSSESDSPEEPAGYLLRGTIDPITLTVTVDTVGMQRIPTQSHIGNLTEEAIVATSGSVYTIHEANGASVNPSPMVHGFDLDLNPLPRLRIVNIEYRITDATAVDSLGRFWVINYLFDGDRELHAEDDPIFARYGTGPTHSERPWVERLVELQITEQGVQLTERPPILLALADVARNWEGVARLGDRGLVIAVDKFPETMLAFVPFPSYSTPAGR